MFRKFITNFEKTWKVNVADYNAIRRSQDKTRKNNYYLKQYQDQNILLMKSTLNETFYNKMFSNIPSFRKMTRYPPSKKDNNLSNQKENNNFLNIKKDDSFSNQKKDDLSSNAKKDSHVHPLHPPFKTDHQITKEELIKRENIFEYQISLQLGVQASKIICNKENIEQYNTWLNLVLAKKYSKIDSNNIIPRIMLRSHRNTDQWKEDIPNLKERLEIDLYDTYLVNKFSEKLFED